MKNQKTQYIIPNKWVGIGYLCNVTGMGRRKVDLYILAGLIDKKKNGHHTLINLEKFNNDMDAGVFEQIDLQNVYKKRKPKNVNA